MDVMSIAIIAEGGLRQAKPDLRHCGTEEIKQARLIAGPVRFNKS
jgi:hypothetical protein